MKDKVKERYGETERGVRKEEQRNIGKNIEREVF